MSTCPAIPSSIPRPTQLLALASGVQAAHLSRVTYVICLYHYLPEPQLYYDSVAPQYEGLVSNPGKEDTDI